MSYKCTICGTVFEEGEQIRWKETHGLDCPPYESFSGCPVCGGDYKETIKCVVCGEDVLPSELVGNVCEYCIDIYKNDLDACYEMGCRIDVDIEINAMLASLLTRTEMEKILFDYLKSQGNIDCSNFIDTYKETISEILEEEGKNEDSKD